MDNNVLVAISGALTLGGTIVSALLSAWREKTRANLEEKHRTWDVEDRQQKAAAMAAALAASSGQVLGKIEENTQVSVKAFNEANDVNAKLARIHARIDGVVADTNAALKDRA